MNLEHLRQQLNDNMFVKIAIGDNNTCLFLLKDQDTVEFIFEYSASKYLGISYFMIKIFH